MKKKDETQTKYENSCESSNNMEKHTTENNTNSAEFPHDMESSCIRWVCEKRVELWNLYSSMKVQLGEFGSRNFIYEFSSFSSFSFVNYPFVRFSMWCVKARASCFSVSYEGVETSSSDCLFIRWKLTLLLEQKIIMLQARKTQFMIGWLALELSFGGHIGSTLFFWHLLTFVLLWQFESVLLFFFVLKRIQNRHWISIKFILAIICLQL